MEGRLEVVLILCVTPSGEQTRVAGMELWMHNPLDQHDSLGLA